MGDRGRSPVQPEKAAKPIANDQEVYNLISVILKEAIVDDKMRKAMHLSMAHAYKNSLAKHKDDEWEGAEDPKKAGLKIMKAFTESWIQDTFDRYKTAAPKSALPEIQGSTSVFKQVLNRGAGPRTIIEKLGPPPEDWKHVERALGPIYKES